MGEAISKILGGHTEQEVKEQLQFLVNAATERLDRYQAEIENGFLDKSIIQRRSVPGNRALRWDREYTVGVGENVDAAIDSFFGIATSSGEEQKDNIVNGFKASRGSFEARRQTLTLQGSQSVVKAALDTFLGNIQAGEHEEQKFFVFVQHNAIVRIDVRLWRYNFSNEKVMANKQNVLCYIICSSVVDRSSLTFDEMIYLLSEHAGDANVEAYIDNLARVWRKMETLPNKNTMPLVDYSSAAVAK